MIKVSNLVFSYPHRRKKLIVDNLIIDGRITLISGDSGSFKSTFVKLIAKRLHTKKGKIENDEDVFYLDQHFSFVEEWTCRENLKEAGCQDYEEYAKRLKIDKLLDYEVVTLSTGQRARLGFLFALCQKEEIIILDEPTRNLDKDNISILENLIISVSSYKKFIIITHDNDFLINHYDLLLKFENGKIVDEIRKENTSDIVENKITLKKECKIKRHLFDKVFTLASIILSIIFGVLVCSSNGTGSPSSYEDSVYTFEREVSQSYSTLQYDVIPEVMIDFELENHFVPDFLLNRETTDSFTHFPVTFSDDISRGTFGLSRNAFDLLKKDNRFGSVNFYDELEDSRLNISDNTYIFSSYSDLSYMTFVLNTDDYLSVMCNLFYETRFSVDGSLANNEVIVSKSVVDFIKAFDNHDLVVGDTITIGNDRRYRLGGDYVVKEIRLDMPFDDIRPRRYATYMLFNEIVGGDSKYISFSADYLDQIDYISRVFNIMVSSPVGINEDGIHSSTIIYLSIYSVISLCGGIVYFFVSIRNNYERNIQRFYKQSKLSLFQYLKKEIIQKRIYAAPCIFLLITLLSYVVYFIYGTLTINYFIISLISFLILSLSWLLFILISSLVIYFRKLKNIE